MDFIRNFPFFSIILAMFSGIVSAAVDKKYARIISVAMITIVCGLSVCVLGYTYNLGESFTYLMGHFPAPWGNEIRAGSLEGLMASAFSLIMLLSVLGGMSNIKSDIEPGKINLFYVLIDLMMSSLLALIYTNDLFTGYVFVEINTIAACGMIIIRQNGHGIVAGIRYMIMSLVGSGLFLIGLSMLYDITGELLMVPAKEAVDKLVQTGTYTSPLLIVVALMSVGLAIKSGLYPFHSWIPETYGYATPTASAILSSLVSKGYIILVVKIFYRVIGIDKAVTHHVMNALFVFGVIAMVMGSIHAMNQKDIRRMIAFSSVAQIGYVYMGIGLGSESGTTAAMFHILTHAATKSLLFISAAALYQVSDGNTDILSLRGAGYRNRFAAIAFTCGSLSMVGFPLFSGFISKYLFATAAMESKHKMIITILALAISTILNAVYFLRVVINLYAFRDGTEEKHTHFIAEPISEDSKLKTAAMVLLIGLNIFLGLFSGIVVNFIRSGLYVF